MQRPRLTYSIIVLFIIILAYGIVQYRLKHQESPKRAIPTVETATVANAVQQPTIAAIGYFLANQGVTLKAETGGRITDIRFTSGQEVKQGDILVVLNNIKETGALKYAKAQHDLSITMYQRNEDLKKVGAVSLGALDEAKATMDSDEGNEIQAQGAYDLTEIKAPFDGRLGLKEISVGDYLETGSEVVTLQNLNPMYIDFAVPEKYLGQIKLGEKVEVMPNTYPGKTFTGQVENFETVINQETGMITARALLANDQGLLLPGGYAEVTLYAGDPRTVLVIPQTAIVYDINGNYVYVVNDHKAVAKKITLGEQVDQSIEVASGLSLGEIVVSAGTNKIHDGSEIIAK